MLLEVMTASDTNVCSAASAVPSAVGVGEIWLGLMVGGCWGPMPCHAMSSDGRRHAPPPGQRPRYMMEIGMMWNPSTNDSTSESPHAKKKSEMPDGDGD